MHRSIRLLAMPALVLGVATTAFGQDANAGRRPHFAGWAAKNAATALI